MSKLEVWAGTCLLAALVGQTWYFRQLLRQLRRLRRSIPAPTQLSVQTTEVSLSEITNYTAEELAQKYAQDVPATPVSGPTVRLALLRAEVYENSSAYQITVAVNRYLVRSRGGVIDFMLIKSLVDRHTRLAEQGVGYLVWIPLLIGIIVLFLASSVGLLFLPDVSDELINRTVLASTAAIFFSRISTVALGVFTGALLTLVALGWLYPRARRALRQRRHELFTLVQVELMPSLSQDATHSLQLLQTGLTQFQQGFAERVGDLQALLNRNQETLRTQERIADALQQVDVMRLVRANADMFQVLSESTEGLDRFRRYLEQMNHFVANTTTLTEKVNEFLLRTERVEDIAVGIRETLAKNERLHHFIASHFSELEDRGQLITQAVVKIDDVLDKSLGELMEHTQRKIQAIRELSAQQEHHLLKTYDENEHMFGKLARIDDLHRNFAEYKTENLKTQTQILEQLQTLNERLSPGSGGILRKIFRS